MEDKLQVEMFQMSICATEQMTIFTKTIIHLLLSEYLGGEYSPWLRLGKDSLDIHFTFREQLLNKP